MMSNIFISWGNEKEKEYAEQLRLFLEKRGYKTFISERKGENWREERDRVLKNCNYVISIIIPSTPVSEEKKLECELALELGKRVIPCIHSRASRRVGMGNTEGKPFEFSDGIELASKVLIILDEIQWMEKKYPINEDPVESERRGVLLFMMGEFVRAREFFKKSALIFSALKSSYRAAKAWMNAGIISLNLKEYDRAVEFFQKALEASIEGKSKMDQGKCYFHLGCTYRKKGDYGKAVEFYMNALDIFSELRESVLEGKCYTKMGDCYLKLMNFEKAWGLYGEALKIFNEMGDEFSKGGCYTNLGNIYVESGDFNRAKEAYERALEIFRKIKNRGWEGKSCLNLGSLYIRMGNVEKGIEYYEMALKVFHETGDKKWEERCKESIKRFQKFPSKLDLECDEGIK